MKRRAVLEVITPHADISHSMPGGLVYVDQMLTEAGLSSQLANDDEALWLRRCLYHLDRRFHGWLRVRLITPMSPLGLVKVIRYRVRAYPTFIMAGQTYTGHNLEELEAFIRRQAGEIVKSEK